ncbi:unnamed protein product, partial [Mesorhabditis spiculigera]
MPVGGRLPARPAAVRNGQPPQPAARPAPRRLLERRLAVGSMEAAEQQDTEKHEGLVGGAKINNKELTKTEPAALPPTEEAAELQDVEGNEERVGAKVDDKKKQLPDFFVLGSKVDGHDLINAHQADPRLSKPSCPMCGCAEGEDGQGDRLRTKIGGVKHCKHCLHIVDEYQPDAKHCILSHTCRYVKGLLENGIQTELVDCGYNVRIAYIGPVRWASGRFAGLIFDEAVGRHAGKLIPDAEPPVRPVTLPNDNDNQADMLPQPHLEAEERVNPMGSPLIRPEEPRIRTLKLPDENPPDESLPKAAITEEPEERQEERANLMGSPGHIDYVKDAQQKRKKEKKKPNKEGRAVTRYSAWYVPVELWLFELPISVTALAMPGVIVLRKGLGAIGKLTQSTAVFSGCSVADQRGQELVELKIHLRSHKLIVIDRVQATLHGLLVQLDGLGLAAVQLRIINNIGPNQECKLCGALETSSGVYKIGGALLDVHCPKNSTAFSRTYTVGSRNCHSSYVCRYVAEEAINGRQTRLVDRDCWYCLIKRAAELKMVDVPTELGAKLVILGY